RAGRVDDRVESDPRLLRPAGDLLDGADVAERSERVRAPLGDDVRPAARARDPVRLLREEGVDPAPLGEVEEPDVGPHPPIEQEVPDDRRIGGTAEEKAAAQPEARARDGGRARVVALDRAAGEDRVRPPLEGLREDELELPDLVPGELAPGEVVALDVDP